MTAKKDALPRFSHGMGRSARVQHQFRPARPSAVYVIETGAGLVLVDAGFESEHDKLRQGFADLRLDPDRVA
jgi:glyoxylase-like metal-dependent hydrolase (beta-lactamase superfamily II)